MSKTNTFSFQTEVKSLLSLMIHSLYSNRDIFLRELISNASDACDKLRFLGVSDSGLLEDNSNLKIRVDYDAKAATLSIADNGIGMNYEEVMENLGTIAKSGTKAFIETLSKSQTKDAHLIGQFGVGFYSAFMVAESVTVLTRKAGLPAHESVKWESKGEGEFQIEKTTVDNRGTTVILKLRDDAKEYLNTWRLQQIIHQYSDHILFPVLLRQEQPSQDEAAQGEAQQEAAPRDAFKQANSAAALWTRSKNEISVEQYQEFYHHVSHDYSEALDWLHFQVEGKQQYTALLYLPKVRSQNLFMREQKNGLKLFIERVFIMDNAELLPNYLRFVKGVIDSSDLPLNVSREILQNNAISEKIKSGLTKKILQFLVKMAGSEAEKYREFWDQFGIILKEGLTEDFEHQKELAELLRFNSTASGEKITLKEYVGRMKSEQTKIYYIIADGLDTAQNSPHLEIFKKKGVEVLLLCDRVDEWMMSYLTEYEGKKFSSIAKGDIDLGETADESKPDENEDTKFSSLLEQLKKILIEQVQDIRLSKRLTDSPACLVAEGEGMSLHLQRIMQEAGQAMPTMKPILELNPRHSLILRLLEEQNDEKIQDWAKFLYDQSLLAEGGTLKNPAFFVKQMNAFILGDYVRG